MVGELVVTIVPWVLLMVALGWLCGCSVSTWDNSTRGDCAMKPETEVCRAGVGFILQFRIDY